MTDNIGLMCLAYVTGLLVLSFAGLHVATVMFILAAVAALAVYGWPVVLNFGNLAWATSNGFLLLAAPMFILLGEILLRSGVTDRMYAALAVWLNRIPGGLLHTNIGACALFAATSGSSVATAATIGTIALPTLKSRGYDERMAVGSIAAGGTLGILIPPSINMIIYGAMTDTSVGRLFVAGVVPGIVLTLCFMALIVVIAILQPHISGRGEPTVSLMHKVRMLVEIVPIVMVFLVVMGSLYGGFATPTESAALGVLIATGIAWWEGRLNLTMLHDAFKSTVRTTGMIMLIIIAAFFLNFVVSLLGIPQGIVQWVKELAISPIATIWLLFAIYLVLGCFLETLSMMITTIPIVTPVVVALGFDPVWFGIFIILMCELALVTPPVGMNLYVVQGIRAPGSSINDVIVGATPFVLVMMLMTVILIYFPALALWLPNKMFNE